MESVDQVGRRERFLQSNFESLSGNYLLYNYYFIQVLVRYLVNMFVSYSLQQSCSFFIDYYIPLKSMLWK
jgi:hypothetical protein